MLASSVSRAVASRRPDGETAVARRAFMFHPNDFPLLSTCTTCEHARCSALLLRGAIPAPYGYSTYITYVIRSYIRMSITLDAAHNARLSGPSERQPRSSIDSSLSAREWRIALRYGAWGCHLACAAAAGGRNARVVRAAGQGRTTLLLVPAADGASDGGRAGCSPPPPARARERCMRRQMCVCGVAIDMCAWR